MHYFYVIFTLDGTKIIKITLKNDDNDIKCPSTIMILLSSLGFKDRTMNNYLPISPGDPAIGLTGGAGFHLWSLDGEYGAKTRPSSPISWSNSFSSILVSSSSISRCRAAAIAAFLPLTSLCC